MPNIRTTFNPTVVITVTDAEYLDLLRQNLVYSVEGGPPIDRPDFSDAQYAEFEAVTSRIRLALDGVYVKFRDTSGNPIPARRVIITIDPTSGEVVDIFSEVV